MPVAAPRQLAPVPVSAARIRDRATTRLNTGPNMRRLLETYEGTSGPNAHKKKKDEYFIRLRPSTLGRLLQPLVDAEESVGGLLGNMCDGGDDVMSVMNSVAPESVAGSSEGNILIYDLRGDDAYRQCHVYGARQYNPVDLHKAANNFPRDVYFYKGSAACDKMIVLYDEDGKSAPAVGNAFVEKGIENTYVVSGGFFGCCAACPSVLDGHPPDPDSLATLMARAGLKPPGAMSSCGGSQWGGSVAGGASERGRCNTAASQSLSRFGGSPQKGHWK